MSKLQRFNSGLIRQLASFGREKADQGPDAQAMAVEMLLEADMALVTALVQVRPLFPAYSQACGGGVADGPISD